jgi:hypothetical protein
VIGVDRGSTVGFPGKGEASPFLGFVTRTCSRVSATVRELPADDILPTVRFASFFVTECASAH